MSLHDSGVVAASPDSLGVRVPVSPIHHQTSVIYDPELLHVKPPNSAWHISVQNINVVLSRYVAYA